MRTEKYSEQVKRLPQRGRHLVAQREKENIIVYQAFNPNIASWAVEHQQFGGSHYSFSRMSWIKPGFLWMMYRAGWAAKEHQQRILAITLSLDHLKEILKEATFSSFQPEVFPRREDWKAELEKTEVRLQWDPDHDPFGNKQERKAIQLGLKGAILKQFCTEWILKIEDITDFVKYEHQKLLDGRIEELLVPFEEVIDVNDSAIQQKVGL